MRNGLWLAAACLALGVSVPRGVQGGVFMGNATQGNIVNQPINTTQNVVAPIPPNRLGTFNLQGLFHRTNIGAWPPTIGSSPMPPPTAFKSTHYPNALNPFIVPKKK